MNLRSLGLVFFLFLGCGQFLGAQVLDSVGSRVVASDSLLKALDIAKDSVLVKSEKMMGVDIKVSGPLIENKVDRLVYNAAQDITSKGGSAADLLSKVPMVEVDMDGNVSIRGSRNLKVLINGRPSGMMAGNVADALRSFPADGIDKVEVITNPSSKYDAEGTAGIINIILKQVRLKGKTGAMNMGLGTRSANLGGDVSIQNGATNFSIKLGGHFWRSWGSGWTNRTNTVNGIGYGLKQNNDVVNWGGGPRLTLSMDHQFNKKSGWEQVTNNFTYGYGLDVNLDYRKNFDKVGRELGISAQYSGSQDNTDYHFTRLTEADLETRKEQSLNIGKNNEISMQIDYTEPLHAKLLWETGLKTTLRSVISNYNYDSFNFQRNNYESITARNNQFDYYQNILALYSQFTWITSSKFSIKSGIRHESTQFGGIIYQPVKESYTGRPYQNFIPYINLNRVIGKAGFLRFTYTKRIQRPSLFYLNPYTNFIDPLNITTGNPRLNAEVSNNYEISTGNYGQIGGWGLNVYHRRIGNAIETMRYVGEDKVYRTTYGNIGINYTSGFDVNMNYKGKQVELWGRFNAPTYTLQGFTTNWFFHMLGVKRRFKNDKGGLGFGLDNPFIPKMDFITRASGQDFDYKNVQRLNMWGVRVNFDYKFGSLTIEKPKPVNRKLQNDDLKPPGGQEGM